MFQIAVKKDMAGNFGGTRALGYIFQIQIIIAAAQDRAPASITAATMTAMKIGTINMMRCEISSRLFTVIVSPCIVSAFTLSQMIDSFNRKGRV